MESLSFTTPSSCLSLDTGAWRKLIAFLAKVHLLTSPCSFAYQVSQLILAHVTKSPFPYWNGMMIFSLLSAIDANAFALFGR